MSTPRSLSRSAGYGRPAAPVRIVHLGLGNFFRAHQAWYTEHAPDAARWGIAAFAGRAAGITTELNAQDGLFTLLVRGRDGDEPEVISSLSAIHSGADLAAWRGYLASPDVAILTTTITEAGYVRNSAGGLDLTNAAVRADTDSLRAAPLTGPVSTAPGKIVAGLLARRATSAPAITLLPCDNIPDNGAMLHRVVTDLAQVVDPSLVGWISEHVCFATTMVDRITPRTTPADIDAHTAASGILDPSSVVTEPFVEWVIAGDFPAGRPAWHEVGARFVDDITPYEHRKLWLLNGSHSLMAYAGSIRGHDTVVSAINDPVVRDWVEQWWDVAGRHLPLPPEEIQAYRQALVERYGNPNIRHLLAQIAADGSQKIPIRILPALLAERDSPGSASGATRAVAAWIAHLRGYGAPVTDATGQQVQEVAQGDLGEAIAAVLAWLGLTDPALIDLVTSQYDELTAGLP